MLELVQRTMKLVKKLEKLRNDRGNWSCLFWSKGDLEKASLLSRTKWKEVAVSISFLRWSVIEWKERVSGWTRGGLDWTLGRISLCKGHSNGLLWEVVELPSLQIFKRCRHGAKGHKLVMGLSRSGWQWDMLILKVFSKLDDSVSMKYLQSAHSTAGNTQHSKLSRYLQALPFLSLHIHIQKLFKILVLYEIWLRKLKYLRQSLFSKLDSWHIWGLNNFTSHFMSLQITSCDHKDLGRGW